MIYTLTLNPAIDYIVKIDNYKHGSVNRTSHEMMLPGGKGINVSTVLTELGIENTALGFVGGLIGIEFEKLLKNNNINCNFVYIKNGSTRINIKIKEEKETEINSSGPHITDDDLKELYLKLDIITENDYLVLSGSIPPSIPDDIYFKIAKRVSTKNIVIDATGNALLNGLLAKPFLIKPNHHELGEIVNRKLKTKNDVEEAALTVQKMGARNVFVSMAENGGIFVSENGDILYLPAPSGKVVNSTGAGDCALAGFLAEYALNNDYKKAFFTGICAGSACAFSEKLATKEEIHSLVERMNKTKND